MLIPGQPLHPGFDVISRISTRHNWFALARLSGPYLTHSKARLLPQRSPPRPFFVRRSLRWFGTSPCRAIPEGRFLHLWCSIAQVEFNLLHRPLLHVRGTQGSLAFRNASSSRDRWRVGQCKRRQRARPKDAFECSGSQAVNSEPEHSNIKFLTTRRALPRRAPRTHARTP